jgi:hypothetical protein
MGHYDSCYEYDNTIYYIRKRIEEIKSVSINEGEKMASDLYIQCKYKTPTDDQILEYVLNYDKDE